MKARLLFTHALTPLYPGTGQGSGVIDLPIAREISTNIPYLPGSSLKGVLRDVCQDAALCKTLFGPESKSISDSNSQAGVLQFTDQRLLLLPVRSLSGTFAWVTSPFILQRFSRSLSHIGVNDAPTIPQPAKDEAHTGHQSGLPLNIGSKKQVILEDLDFTAVTDQQPVTDWAEWLGAHLFPTDNKGEGWRKTLSEKLCLLHDDRFGFLLETGTEVIARNVLDDNKTSENLWYEEALPAESILEGFVIAQAVGKAADPDSALTELVKLTTGLIQLGGHATIGRGFCRVIPA
jgi:CRISPR-associated protein Cmr4